MDAYCWCYFFFLQYQDAINKVGDIIESTDIGEAWEEGDIGEVLNDIGEIIVRSGEAAAGVLEEKVSEIIGTITGAISDPTKAGTVLGGVIGTAFPSIPQWLPSFNFRSSCFMAQYVMY